MAEIAPADLASLPDLMGAPGVASLWAPQRMAQVARTRLVTLAQQRLHTSAKDYIRGILPVRMESAGNGRTRFVVELRGALPNMVEHGRSAWDLRLTILKPGTRRIKTSRAGYLYVSIPFRHMGPGAGGTNAPAMGSQFTQASLHADSKAFRGQLTEAAAKALGRAARRAAQGLSPTLSAVGGGRVQYGKGTDGRLAEGLAPVLRPRHATDIFAGMIREEKTYESATQSQYTTFRTISQNPASKRSDAGGQNWEHPGIKPRRLMPEVADYLQQLFQAGAFNV